MKLSLTSKGPVRPPPELAGAARRVAAEIAVWPGVTAATHWHLYRQDEVDGADFYAGDEELGHIHLDGEVHLASIADLKGPLLSARLARPFRFGGSYAGWAEASIASEADADHALWLFRLNYDRIAGVPLPTLLDRIAVRRAETGASVGANA